MVDTLIAAVTLPGAFAVVLLISATVINARDVRRRDAVPCFTRQQHREGMARAGGQSERKNGFGRRCGRPAEHFYPWSEGGSTSFQNFVAACARCNRAKRAGIPSPGQQQRLERRRRDYVPPSSSISAANGGRSPGVRLVSALRVHQQLHPRVLVVDEGACRVSFGLGTSFELQLRLASAIALTFLSIQCALCGIFEQLWFKAVLGQVLHRPFDGL